MSFNNEKLAKFIAENTEYDENILLDALNKYNEPRKFSNKNVEAYFEENDSPENVVATGKKGLITLNDIKRALGIEVKKKTPSEWVSADARKLAEQYELASEDFSEEDRSGNSIKSPLQSGCEHRITISDVRARLLKDGIEDVEDKFYTTKGVAKLAKDSGLSPSDFNNIKGRKIKEGEVKEKIAAMTQGE